MSKRGDRLKQLYTKLRDVGYSSSEARKYRNYSEEKVGLLIRSKKAENIASGLDELAKGKSRTERMKIFYQALKQSGFSSEEARRFRSSSLEHVKEAIYNLKLPPIQEAKRTKAAISYLLAPLRYRKKYSYKFQYKVDTGFFGIDTKYIVVSFDEEKSRKWLRHYLIEDVFNEKYREIYKARVIPESIKLVAAYKQTPENLAKMDKLNDERYGV